MEEKLGLVGRAGDGINSFSFVSDTLVKKARVFVAEKHFNH